MQTRKYRKRGGDGTFLDNLKSAPTNLMNTISGMANDTKNKVSGMTQQPMSQVATGVSTNIKDNLMGLQSQTDKAVSGISDTFSSMFKPKTGGKSKRKRSKKRSRR